MSDDYNYSQFPILVFVLLYDFELKIMSDEKTMKIRIPWLYMLSDNISRTTNLQDS